MAETRKKSLGCRRVFLRENFSGRPVFSTKQADVCFVCLFALFVLFA